MIKFSKIFTPKVLSGLAVVGTVATAILAAADGMKAKEDISKAYAEYPEDRKKTRLAVSTYMVPRVGGHFIRSISCAGGTIALIVVSSYMSGLQIATLTGTISYLVMNRDKVEKEVSKVPGAKEAIAKAKEEIAKTTAEQKIKEEKQKSKSKLLRRFTSVEETDNGDLLCVDLYSGRVFRSSLDAVEQAQCRFNDDREEGLPFGDEFGEDYILAKSYNDLFDEYCLEHNHWGYMYGWKSVKKNSPKAKRIPFENTLIPYEKLVESGKDKYGEDVLMISIADPELYPVEGWGE